mgnify:CR=1 FL=1
MKKENYKRIAAIMGIMDSIDISDIIREISAKEQERFDNWSETTQDGEKGELQQEMIDHLDAAADAFDEFYSELNEAMEIET